ncbi:fumitremorgin C synthase [Aspergillus lentulus]|uniref:Fumitremorgin C synthase n=1 Tax=Aspergillus lentulus TaxID=293939 RepID=A0AAN6BPG7_ASPLE|nr:fumitremorgin C synthase [Aspergillus lentulus]KAF4156498.1 hypothetical protein CNMCM6069_006650 [Aspergillus lentulus]KAF4166946.1 hypothetical protein CNMCM6936_005855 [Aspergillus lentulus]KAF4203990.1 hypothetical protein CNMCM8927_008031 [Aspergillus lentulus]GFF43267.1 fumitremorgin C synthase [Aspergillus lentulus]
MLLATTIVLAIIYYIHGLLVELRRQKRLPPGPMPLPLIGNLHQHRTTEPWVQYQEWHKKLGPIIKLEMGQRTVIVLGNHETVNELLNRRGKVYCSPPRFAFCGDCMSKSTFPIFLPYSTRRREIHRLLVTTLAPSACKAYADVQERESLRLAFRLLVSDANIKNIWAYSVGVSTTLTSGQQMTPDEEEEIGDFQQAFKGIKGTLSKENLFLELYPFLNILPRPINRWKKTGEAHRQHLISLWTRRVERGLKNSNWNWTRILHDNKPQDMSRDEFLFLVAELEIAAVSSTALLIMMFTATALKNPAATQRVREEIDAVIGAERLPTFNDQERLPLLNAYIKEIFRWKSFAPLSMPFTGLEDSDYMGYHIPSDALVIANLWALNMDPEVYTDPESFRPERWLENPELPDPPVFGFGRRVCPGELFGKNSLFIAFAQILWAFDILPPDEGARGLPPSQSNTAMALIANWDINHVKFKLRSPDRAQAIEEKLQRLQGMDNAYLDKAAHSVRLQLAKTRV